MNAAPMTEPPPTQTKPLRDLMEEIAVYQDSSIPSERKTAEAALMQLQIDYGDLLWKLVHNLLGPEDEDTYGTLIRDRDEIFSLLIQRIWKYADSFDPKGADLEEVRKQFVGWAATTLRNIVSDIHRNLQAEQDQLEYLEEIWSQSFDGCEESERIHIVREVLEEMSPEDAEVLRWSAPLIPLDGSSMQPDPKERQAICDQLGVTPEGLRKRRSRALKKLKEELNSRFNQ